MEVNLNPLSSLIGFAGKVIDRVIPDPEKKDEAHFKLAQLAQNGELEDLKADLEVIKTVAEVDKGQIGINAIDAQSERFFQYGPRPAALWMCVAGLGYTFLGQPIGSWIMANTSNWTPLPELDVEVLLFMASGLLGLGTLRTIDKRNKAKWTQGDSK